MVMHAIRVYGELTRVDLATISGLTAPAISNITRRLLEDGLLEESGQRRGGRGQPARRLKIRAEARHAIGVNIDRDHVTLVVVDFAGKILARATRNIQFALPEQVRSFYTRTIVSLLKEAAVEPETLLGIGVAVPDDLGALDVAGRPQTYMRWTGIDFAELLAEPFGLPVFVENDAAAAALGELQFGLGQKYSSFFYVLISAQLGGSLVVDGAIFRGSNGRSGEVGFMPYVDENGVQQIQSFVSLAGLSGQLEEAGLGLGDLADRSVPSSRTASIIDTWVSGSAKRLQSAIEAIDCLINPDAVLIGGRLPAGVIDQLADAVQRRIVANRLSVPIAAPILRASLATDAPAVGAATLPIGHFLLPHAGSQWKRINSAEEVGSTT